MQVVAFNGSPRKDGNTQLLLKEVLKHISNQGIETEMIQVGGRNIKGCISCYQCFANKNRCCAVKNDLANEFIAKAVAADAILMGSPTYFTSVTAEMKAFLDRLGLVSLANDGLLKRKIGAAVVAVRRGGAVHVFDTINHMFQMSQMLLVGSTYWNFATGFHPGDVVADEEGLNNMKDLGETIAWLLHKVVT